jgi:hypothetical protein
MESERRNLSIPSNTAPKKHALLHLSQKGTKLSSQFPRFRRKGYVEEMLNRICNASDGETLAAQHHGRWREKHFSPARQHRCAALRRKIRPLGVHVALD